MAESDLRTTTTTTVVVDDPFVFTLTTLCQASGAQREQVHALVGEGVLQPTGPGPDDWQFSVTALPRTRTALRLGRDLELDVAAVALVMELLAEIDRLRARLERR